MNDMGLYFGLFGLAGGSMGGTLYLLNTLVLPPKEEVDEVLEEDIEKIMRKASRSKIVLVPHTFYLGILMLMIGVIVAGYDQAVGGSMLLVAGVIISHAGYHAAVMYGNRIRYNGREYDLSKLKVSVSGASPKIKTADGTFRLSSLHTHVRDLIYKQACNEGEVDKLMASVAPDIHVEFEAKHVSMYRGDEELPLSDAIDYAKVGVAKTQSELLKYMLKNLEYEKLGLVQNPKNNQ